MLTLDEAKAIATNEISGMSRPDLELVVLDEFTIAKPYGWVFFFNTRKFQENKDTGSAIFGNGPIVVRHNKKVVRLTSAMDSDESIAAFEKEQRIKKVSVAKCFAGDGAGVRPRLDGPVLIHFFLKESVGRSRFVALQ